MKSATLKNFVTLSVILVLTAGCSTTGADNGLASKSESISTLESKEEKLKLAQVAEQNNDLAKAIFYYIQALEFDNKSAETLFKIGDAQKKLGNTQLAIRAFRQALVANPDYVPALTQMGIFSLEQKNSKKARILLERALKLDQQRLDNNLADNNYVELDHQSPIQAYNVYAVLNDLESRHEFARELFMLVLQVKENSPLILSNLGYSYYLSGNYILAETYFKKAMDVDPNFERAKLNLGLIYVRNGQYNRAIQILKQVMTDAEAYNDIGYFLMLEGRYKEAEYFLQNAIDLSPSYFEKGNANLENVQMYLNEVLVAPEGQ